MFQIQILFVHSTGGEDGVPCFAELARETAGSHTEIDCVASWTQPWDAPESSRLRWPAELALGTVNPNPEIGTEPILSEPWEMIFLGPATGLQKHYGQRCPKMNDGLFKLPFQKQKSDSCLLLCVLLTVYQGMESCWVTVDAAILSLIKWFDQRSTPRWSWMLHGPLIYRGQCDCMGCICLQRALSFGSYVAGLKGLVSGRGLHGIQELHQVDWGALLICSGWLSDSLVGTSHIAQIGGGSNGQIYSYMLDEANVQTSSTKAPLHLQPNKAKRTELSPSTICAQVFWVQLLCWCNLQSFAGNLMMDLILQELRLYGRADLEHCVLIWLIN